MTAPKRVQMSRQRPWRADNPDAVIVARPSKWGNPYLVGENYLWLSLLPWPLPTFREPGEYEHGLSVARCPDRATAVAWYRPWLEACIGTGTDLSPLAGCDLACWCPLNQPCHADVLLNIANAS